ncbi:hypothetical protein ACWC4D_33810 [Streptomyces sp. NPDC001288]
MAGSYHDRLNTAASLLREVGHGKSVEADRLAEAGDTSAAGTFRRDAELAFDSAAAVESVVSSRGYMLLEREEIRGSTSTLSLTIDSALKKALVDAGGSFGVVFSGLAEDAYRRVRDERWVPEKQSRARSRQSKAVLNVSVNDTLRSEVRAMLPELSETAGYQVAEANIVLTYICDELGIERFGAKGVLKLRFPQPLIKHWQDRAAELGTTVLAVAEEVLPAFLDGSWVPSIRDPKARTRVQDESGTGRTVWSVEGLPWANAEIRSLSLPLDEDLLAGLRARAEVLSQEAGYLVYPGAVVRAILTDRLGEPAE